MRTDDLPSSTDCPNCGGTGLLAFTEGNNEPVYVCRMCGRWFLPAATDDTDRLLEAVAEVTGQSLDEIKGRSRRNSLVRARQLAAYVGHNLMGIPYETIAEALCQTHTTSLRSLLAFIRLMNAMEEEPKKQLEAVKAKLNLSIKRK